jgi:cellulose biosynthesis protein BcsQ
MTVIISSFSTKGGVGKTSFAKYFGVTKAAEGKKVLLVDMCQNGDVAARLGYERDSFEKYTQDWVTDECSFKDVLQYDEETNLYFVPANHKVESIIKFADKKLMHKEFILKEKIDSIKDNFDLVIIDNHPTETNLMMVLSLVSSDYVIIPTLMDDSSLQATIRSAEIVSELNGMGLNIQYFVQPMNVDIARGVKQKLKEVISYLNGRGFEDILPEIRYSTTVQTSSLNGEEFSKKDSKYAKNVMNDYKKVSEFLTSKGVK